MELCPPALKETDPSIFLPSRRRVPATAAMTSRMTETKKKAGTGADKDLVARLADKGEEALQRLAELPGGQKAMAAVNDLRTRVDELAKKVRGLDGIDARVAKLEKEVAALKKAKTPARRSTPRKPTS